jgi:bis(5'-nucleosyl)-tetraphosphatase (symmetrical)
VQGCRAELDDLLAAMKFDAASDRLEPAGDLVNRGPDSAGVIRLLMGLDTGGVLGNHDLHLLRRARGLSPARPRDTLDGVLAAPDRDAMLAWLAGRPLAKEWTDVLLVHAGLDPTWKDPVARLARKDPLADDDDVAFATRVRYCAADGRRPARDDPPPGKPFRPWYEHWEDRERRMLVFGHWARRGLVRRPRVRGLDTGCVWGGRLTAWIAEEDRLVSVPARRAYATV